MFLLKIQLPVFGLTRIRLITIKRFRCFLLKNTTTCIRFNMYLINNTKTEFRCFLLKNTTTCIRFNPYPINNPKKDFGAFY